MVKSVFSGAWRMGRATALALGVAVMLALVVGVASSAFGANGDNWKLGKSNFATQITKLGGNLGVNGAMVRLTNNNAGTDDTALDLQVQTGEAPMTVNSSTRVDSLNADQVDGKSASEFVANNIYKRESAIAAGTDKGDGTFVIGQACDPGDVLLSGGPANVNGTSSMVESFPSPGTTNSWSARIQKNGLADNFSVVVICADQ
ncbi:MAG TPA: hypothetical protein VJ827_13470 [Rubrobacter sp.]|nr:hypothetical protein [Rubrobacter sp.]